jgi:hypothetical protein
MCRLQTEFEFEVVDEHNDILDIDVYDWDKVCKKIVWSSVSTTCLANATSHQQQQGSNNDLLGVVHVPVASVTACGQLTRDFNLVPRHGKAKKSLGSVTVKLVYYDANGKVPGAAQPAGVQQGQPVQQLTPDQMAANAFRQVFAYCVFVVVRQQLRMTFCKRLR